MSIFNKVRFGQATPQAGKPKVEEIGATGVTIFAGIIASEEYNTELIGVEGRKIFEKMWRSDGQIASIIRACSLPIIRCDWAIEPYDADDSKSVEIAEQLSNNLFEGLDSPWSKFVREALRVMYVNGFAPFEKLWRYDEPTGLWVFKDFKVRLPSTITRWYVDTETNEFQGIQQSTAKGETFAVIDIPGDKMVLFVNEQTGDDYEGMSLLRQAYKHWYYKDNLLRIDAISAERHGVGMPAMKHPNGLSNTAKEKMQSIMQKLQSHEKGYITYGEGYEFTMHGLTGQLKSILPSIQYHDKQIAKSVLAQFIDTGQDGKGSYALHEDQSDLFLLALDGMKSNFIDTFTRMAIRQWVNYNYGTEMPCPRLVGSGMRTKKLIDYATALKSMFESNAIKTGPSTEERLRSMFDLPEEPEIEEPEAPSGPGTPPPANPITPEEDEGQADPGEEEDKEEKAEAGKSKLIQKRPLQGAEKFVAFEEIERIQDAATDEFVNKSRAVFKKQINKLVGLAIPILKSNDAEAIADITIPYKGELTDIIASLYLDMFDRGKAQVRDEIERQTRKFAASEGDPIGAQGPDATKGFLKSKAKMGADQMVNAMKSVLGTEMYKQLKAGTVDEETIRDLLDTASDKRMAGIARQGVSEAFNFGRKAMSDELGGIKEVQYSAVLDENTCSECESMDGTTWKYSDTEWEIYSGGNPNCLGGGACRCLLIFISEEETDLPGGEEDEEDDK